MTSPNQLRILNGLVEFPQISLCMIVRDASRTISACLDSIRPWVDEMIIVDTGSTDDTREIAARFGGAVYRFPWSDSFSDARNESLRHAHGKWLFWMDADDVIDADNGAKLRAIATNPTAANVLGFVIQVHCPGADLSDVTVVDHIKMFRNCPELRFEGRIHEQILPAIRRAGGDVVFTETFVVHAGSDQTQEGRQRKQKRDLRLLLLEAVDRPNHPFTLFNLGMTYLDMDRPIEAIIALEASLAFSSTTESHVRKLYALLATSYAASGRAEQAMAVCRRGLEIYPSDVELLFRGAGFAHRSGKLIEARDLYLDALNARETRVLRSRDQSLDSYKSKYNLGLVYMQMGCAEEAIPLFEQVLAERPRHLSALHAAVDAFVTTKQPHFGYEFLKAKWCADFPMGDLAILRSRLAGLEVGNNQAETILREHLVEHRSEVSVLRELGGSLYSQGKLVAAEKVLVELLGISAEDPSVNHNLGLVRVRLGRYSDALGPLRRAQELRPNWPPTEELLSSCEQNYQDTLVERTS